MSEELITCKREDKDKDKDKDKEEDEKNPNKRLKRGDEKREEEGGRLHNVDIIESKQSEENEPASMPVDVDQTIAKLKAHMLNAKKREKATDLMLQFCNSLLSPATSEKIFHAVQEVVTTIDISDKTNFSPKMAELVSRLIEKSYAFTHIQMFNMKSWLMKLVYRFDLYSDDSFTFAKAIQNITLLLDNEELFPTISSEKIDNEEKIESEIDAESRRTRISYGLSILKILFSVYFREWAKQPIDQLFTKMSSKRYKLDEDQRELLDELNTTFMTVKRKTASAIQESRTVRQYDSTAHPMHHKRVEYN